MKKDYAKNKTARKKYRKKTSRILILIIVFLVVAIISVFAPTKHRPRFFHLTKKYLVKNIENGMSHFRKPRKLTPTNTITKAVTSPRFDFYNILPGRKTIAMGPEYELGIAKTKDFAAADRLKAELTLQGFTTHITPMYEHGVQKYHVSIGPYSDKKTALEDQRKLRKNKFQSFLKKIH